MNLCTVVVLSFWVLKAQEEERVRNYMDLLATEDENLISNTTETDCPICFSMVQPGEGIVLRECLHTFCRSNTANDCVDLSAEYVVQIIKNNLSAFQKSTFSICMLWKVQRLVFDRLVFLLMYLFLFRECLKGTIVNSQDAEVSCPEMCDSKLLDREIKAVIVRLEISKSFNFTFDGK